MQKPKKEKNHLVIATFVVFVIQVVIELLTFIFK